MQKTSNAELGRLTTEEYKNSAKMPVVVVLDNIRSANNVGSFFRTADAMGVRELILCGITATPPSKEIHKTALSAELVVEWRYFDNTLDAVTALRNDGYIIVAVEQVHGAMSLEKFQIAPDKAYAFVLGNEVDGVAQEVVSECDMAVEIPQAGTKHSLNVSVAAGVVLWEIFRKTVSIDNML